MIEAEDIAILMKSVGSVMREYVGAAIAAVTGRVAELETAIKSIPAGPKGDPGQPGESIKGDPGEKGELGEKGERGEPGPAGPVGMFGGMGPVGDPGIPGPAGEKGLDGKDGRDGRDGISGKDGRDGEPGRDALQIEILPMVEEGKSYPRGTFAKHKGGLIRAVRNTGPFVMAELEKSGWEVIVEGLYNVVVFQDESLRSFTVECVRTSGYVHINSFQLPVLLDRGIFRDGNEYEKGDVVTWDSSMWICVADQTKAKPGTADWRMSVKKGQNGKDGINGKDGAPAPGVKL